MPSSDERCGACKADVGEVKACNSSFGRITQTYGCGAGRHDAGLSGNIIVGVASVVHTEGQAERTGLFIDYQWVKSCLNEKRGVAVL